MRPGSTRRVKHGDISPSGTCLTVIETRPVRMVGVAR